MIKTENYLSAAEYVTSDAAILSFGSLEQHGRHLPLACDSILAQAYADEIGKRVGAFVLPCLPFSTAYEHAGKKGTVWLDNDVFYGVLINLAEKLKDQGFRKLIIIRGHGGAFAAGPAVRHLNYAYNPGFSVCLVDPFHEEALGGILESDIHIHAEEMETSLMLYLRPELVDMTKAVDFIPDAPRDYLNYGDIFNYSPAGVWGHPTLATAEKGKLCFEAGVRESVKYIREIFAMTEGRNYKSGTN